MAPKCPKNAIDCNQQPQNVKKNAIDCNQQPKNVKKNVIDCNQQLQDGEDKPLTAINGSKTAKTSL